MKGPPLVAVVAAVVVVVAAVVVVVVVVVVVALAVAGAGIVDAVVPSAWCWPSGRMQAMDVLTTL